MELKINLKAAFALSFVAGVAQGVSIAPHWALVQLLSLAVLFYLFLNSKNVKNSLLFGFLFGLGWFSTSIHWVYYSIHDYGYQPAWIAVAGVVAFAALLSLFPALAGLICGLLNKLASYSRLIFLILLCPAAWGLTEWLRTWVLSGFPWAAGSYAHIEGPLIVFAPIVGATGINFLAALVAGLICAFIFSMKERKVLEANLLAVVFLLILGSAFGLRTIEWSRPGETINFRLIQGGVAQDEKFSPMGTERSFKRYIEEMKSPGLKSDAVIVLPETIFPIPFERLPKELLKQLTSITETKGNPLIFGTFMRTPTGSFANAAVLIEKDSAPFVYFKKHLVPFGEYVPFGFRWFIDMLGIPMADLQAGEDKQPPFKLNNVSAAPTLCYEDLFGQVIRQWWQTDSVPGILINLSNLGWFGDSTALPQHLNISRMRAIEFSRPIVRATNTGATAAINEKGVVIARLPYMVPGKLDVQVVSRKGLPTPYAKYGDMPSVIVFITLLLILSGVTLVAGNKRKKRASKS